MLKKTPFHSIHEKEGGKLVEFAGFEMPVQYKGIKIEHAAVRDNVGVFDVSHMGEFFITGENALELIQKVTVNDASKLIPGKAQYSCMCYEDGGIVDDLIIYMLAENEYMLVVNGANVDKDFEWVSSQNSMNAELVNRSDDYALLAVQGPKSAQALQKLTNVDMTEVGFYAFTTGKLAGVDMIISGTGYTGEKGFELYFTTDGVDVEAVWNAIFEAGEEFGIEPCGLGARDTLRLEMGFALYGNDITKDTHPLEARLGWITKFDKGNFVGKEALLEKKEAGNSRQLVGFVMNDERNIPRHGYEIRDEQGNTIGEVASGTMSITLGKGIGMGYVKKEFATEGNSIHIVIRKKTGEAIINRPPFIKIRALLKTAMARLDYMDVYFSVQSFQEEELRGKSAVIIDVLRAASSMVTALSHGAKKVIPVSAMEDAVRIAQTMDNNDYLLCGEQNGNKIEGFHLGNSPLEYTEEVVGDKTLIINTTNGTKAIKKASLANRTYVGCFLNQKSILTALEDHDDDVVLICSGWQGKMALEDTLFAGSVIYNMCEGTLPSNVKDGVKIAFSLYKQYKDTLEETISGSDHAFRLKELVPDGDIPFVCEVDKFDALPGMKDGILINLNG